MTDLSTTAGTAAGPAAPKISQSAINYAESRGISRETLERLGVGSGTAYFPRRLERQSEAVFFPYFCEGERVNYKACAFPEKDFIGEKGGKLVFFNLDAVLAGPLDTVFIVEGEWDAASLIEAGIPQHSVLSVPNGARETADGDDAPRGYGFVEEALDLGLSAAKRFVFCGDSDDPGRKLRRDMAQILGAARFWFVDWPEGCKDANDMLRTDGPEPVMDLVVNGALPWPVDGLFRMSQIPEPPPMEVWLPGFPEWENKLAIGAPAMSVVTGHPNHGKTAFCTQIWFQIARKYDIRIAVWSPETDAKPHHRRTIRTLYSGKLEKDMSPQEIKAADEWIDDHYLWMQHPDDEPTLEWLFDTAEVAVVRHGAKVIQGDPFNQLEGQRDFRETETDYIGRCLRGTRKFAKSMGVHWQWLAHPAKMHSSRRGEPPLLEDISGSKHWDNMVDQGWVVHRPNIVKDGKRQTECDIYYRKARFPQLGHPCLLHMDFNLSRWRYESIDYRAY